MTITGTDDAPVISGDVAGAVIEDIGSYAAQFDGSSSIRLHHNEPETNISREIIFRTSDAGGLFEVNDGGHDRHLYITDDGQIASRVWSNEVIESSGLNLRDGQVHELVFTLGSRGTDIYIDGTLVAHGSKSGSNYDWGNYQFIGHSSDSGPFTGDILSYRAWDRELSASEAMDPSGLTSDHEFVFDANSFPDNVIDTGTAPIDPSSISVLGTPTVVAMMDGSDPTAYGALSVTDVDDSSAAFHSETVAGDYGAVTIDVTGEWAYTVDNDLAAVQSLSCLLYTSPSPRDRG